MAKEKATKSKIQDMENSGFGEYQEAVGGGHPFEAGNSNTRTSRANGKLREKENPDTMQPRDSMGHFTYKSVNGQSIDPKYGPSRGKTVNPLLTGGDGTIKIDDVEKQFGSKQGSLWDKYKDKWYTKGGEIVLTDMKTKVAGQAIWDLAKQRYDKVKGEFMGESSVFSSKSGRKTQEEKAAASEVAKTGKEAYVYEPKSGGIKAYHKKGEAAPEMPKAEPAPAPEMPKAPEVPEAPKAPEMPKEELPKTSEFEGVKYTEDNGKKVVDFFQSKFGSAEPEKAQKIIDKFKSLSPEQKDKQIDLWKSKGVDFGF